MVLRRKCRKPTWDSVPDDEALRVELPPRGEVEERIREAVRDEIIADVIVPVVKVIYDLPGDHIFKLWVKKAGLAYHLVEDPECWRDSVAAMTLAFFAYCKNHTDDENCRIIKLIHDEVKAKHSMPGASMRDAIRFTRKWKKSTDALSALWERCEKRYCKLYGR